MFYIFQSFGISGSSHHTRSCRARTSPRALLPLPTPLGVLVSFSERGISDHLRKRAGRRGAMRSLIVLFFYATFLRIESSSDVCWISASRLSSEGQSHSDIAVHNERLLLNEFFFISLFPKRLQAGCIKISQVALVFVRVGRCGSMPGGGGGREKHSRIRGRPAQVGLYQLL